MIAGDDGDRLALGELEMVFAIDLLSWLCKRHVIGSITLRNALLAIRPPEAKDVASRGRLSPKQRGHRW